MRIGELAERAGTSTRTLRYYESQGLLSTRRDTNGYRDYDEGDLRLVSEIRSRLAMGFGLTETRPFVDCLRAGNESGAVCPDSIQVFRRKLDDLDRCIAALNVVRQQVSEQLAAAVNTRGGCDHAGIGH
jgi:DNA-binding transcriptional MerR regulator